MYHQTTVQLILQFKLFRRLKFGKLNIARRSEMATLQIFLLYATTLLLIHILEARLMPQHKVTLGADMVEKR